MKKKKVVAIAQARMGSTRVPGKVMRDLGGIPVLQWTINALREAPGIDDIVLATSTNPDDDVIETYCKNHRINSYRGSETDVLSRYYGAAEAFKANIILRLTCDCPFLDPNVVSEVIRLREIYNADYASNVDPPTYPDGLDTECFTFSALEQAHREATRPTDRDCVTQFIIRNRSRFPAVNLHCPLPGMVKERWVLDTENDWKFCNEIVDRLGVMANSYLQILDILDKEPQLREINNNEKGSLRNERLFDALASEQLSPRTFERSQRIFKRTIQTIPFGAQTFSKSHIQYPEGRSPLFVSHGDGARIFDVDGNDYVDLVNALLPVVLGYRDPDVDGAVRHQLDSGISFSLATELEVELSETLCRLIPCAEMVKFGKSGTDVTTAAIRLARAYTGRDHVFVGGYHGWADWSMACSDRSLGIPADVKRLSHKFRFGDPDFLIGLNPESVAAIIVEPNDDPDYLKHLRHLATSYGIVLIFDEIITGFRYDMGGAQTLYGVAPDLATFGKSMANGMPISALVGKRDIMKRMSPPDNIFYSGTFFGETLSIAAAIATIKKMEEQNVIEHLWNKGAFLEGYMAQAIVSLGLTHAITVSGECPRIVLDFKDQPKANAAQLKTLFMKEMIQNGVLTIGANNMSFAHKGPEITRITSAYKATLTTIADALEKGDILRRIGDSVSFPTPLRQPA